MAKYIPIKLDKTEIPLHKQKTLHGRWCFLLWYLTNKTKIPLYIDWRYQRQIDRQLKERKEFPQDEWKKCFNDKNVNYIVQIIKSATEAVRFNHHYIPDDRLEFLLLHTPVDDIVFYMSCDVKEFFGKDFERMLKKNYTLKDFFKELIEE